MPRAAAPARAPWPTLMDDPEEGAIACSFRVARRRANLPSPDLASPELCLRADKAELGCLVSSPLKLLEQSRAANMFVVCFLYVSVLSEGDIELMKHR